MRLTRALCQSQDRGVRPHLIAFVLILVGCKTAPAPTEPSPVVAAPPTANADAAPATAGPVFAGDDLDTSAEAVGPLRQGQAESEVLSTLGAPDEKPAFVMMEATGEFVSDWPWADKGLVLTMAAADASGASATVSGITCGKSCAFELPWGLKIGSTRAEVEAVYGDHFDKAFTDEHTFVAGSVYGGSFYRFESDRVVGIFIGAGAE